jgi:hypothetical protein
MLMKSDSFLTARTLFMSTNGRYLVHGVARQLLVCLALFDVSASGFNSAIILSHNHQLPLPVSSFIALTLPAQPTQ